MEKKIEAPFKPPARRGTIDVTNFDTEFTREKAVDSVVPTSIMTTEELSAVAFEGFSYIGKSIASGAGGGEADELAEINEEDEEDDDL